MHQETLHLIHPPHIPQSAEPLSDADVVKRVLAGERALFEILMRRYNERIYRVVRAVLGREEDVADVMQEAYVRAFSRLSTYSGEGSFPAWLSRIATREALRLRRKRSRYQSLDPASASFERSEANIQQYPDIDVELRDLIAAEIDSLPPRLRAVFVLRQIEQLSARETAESLGMTTASVKTGYHRARRKLQHSIEQALGEELEDIYQFGGRHCDRLVEAVLARIGKAATG